MEVNVNDMVMIYQKDGSLAYPIAVRIFNVSDSHIMVERFGNHFVFFDSYNIELATPEEINESKRRTEEVSNLFKVGDYVMVSEKNGSWKSPYPGEILEDWGNGLLHVKDLLAGRLDLILEDVRLATDLEIKERQEEKRKNKEFFLSSLERGEKLMQFLDECQKEADKDL